jgi:DNA-3-methyladenine glycosylase
VTRARARFQPLPPSFHARPAERVARDLLGTLLVSTIGGEAVGRIAETEAYVGPHDAASHAAERVGRTSRNASMFGPPGIAYIYRSYGVHWCLNVVTDAPDFPAAVLIRAFEPVSGVARMRRRRHLTRPGAPDAALGSGPGNVAAALGITGDQDGHALDRPPLWIAAGDAVPDARVQCGPRIGITRAADWPLRYWIGGSPSVSRR